MTPADRPDQPQHADRAVLVAGHLLFAVLLVIGTASATLHSPDRWPPLVAAAVTAGWYGLGARAAERLSRTRARLWLLGLTVLWIGLILVSRDFIWLAFLLSMLLWQFFAPRVATPLVCGVAAACVLAWRAHSDRWEAGAVVGPVVGVAVAAVITMGYQRARAHSAQYRQLLDDLVTTQQALATREREAGMLAERERLARDIHDGVGQSLASVILLLRAARGPAMAHAPAACVEQLDTALDTAMSALAETRRLVRGQEPVALEQGGLTEALAAQAADSTALGLPTTLAVHGDPRRLDISAEVALLRAAQEALSNARKHAAAHHATVTLTFQDDEVSVDIVDDGVGFAADRVAGRRPDGTGYGLTGMQTRLAERGGEVAIESEPGAGTAVRAIVPTVGAADGVPLVGTADGIPAETA